MLEWSKLLSGERRRPSKSKATTFRNEFDKDYDRIIYSSSLRRLQDKAQVFPLQDNDFIRTRLTHSLEVASLGRSLAWNIGEWLMDTEEYFKEASKVKELASLVEVTCLVHDLGNPPFGHYGEDIIRNWFDDWFESEEFEKACKKHGELDEQQKHDFMYFEGNAQAIRILSKLQFLNDHYGVNFTIATLATLMKYPWPSNHEKTKEQKANKKSIKFGYFSSESEIYKDVNRVLGLEQGCRHPATYILEAADDIAYLTADIEDAVKKRVISWDVIYKEVKYKLNESYPEVFEDLEEKRKEAIDNGVPNRDLINIQNFKVAFQGVLINAAVRSFKENYSDIMKGSFKGDLLNNSTAKTLAKTLSQIAVEHVFSNREVLTLELVGDRVITDLLNLFVPAVINVDNLKKSKTKHQKLVKIISENFRHIQKINEDGRPEVEFEELSLYNRLLLVTDFISGMTDRYAVHLHQELLGVKLP